MKRAYLTQGVAAAALLLGSGVAIAQQDQPGEGATQQDAMDAQGGMGAGIGPGSSERIGAGTAFNPSISVILDGVYTNTFSGEVDDPGGFEGGHSHGHGHDHGGGGDGFQLRETEFAFEASVDPYFDAFAMLVVEGTDTVDLEEAYFTTSSLPWGLQIKGGRFLSDIGYINNQHPHEWDFVDRPLVSEHLFGHHGIQETGVQLNWLLPTRTYLKGGVEVLQGDTSGVANYVGHDRAEFDEYFVDGNDELNRVRERQDLPFEDASGPRLFTGFLKWGPDLGYDHAAQFGISGGYARAFQRSEEHGTPRVQTWDGDAWFAGLDAVYKYDAAGYLGHGDLTIQGEYFYREQDLDFEVFKFADDQGGGPDDWTWESAESADVRYRQDGAYLQAVYGIAPRWRTGVRAEALGIAENRAFDGDSNPSDDFGTSYRYSLNTTFYPSHFSFLRAQVNYADYAAEDPGGDRHDEWSFMLQYNISIGAHGAHPF
ncbi:zinc-regulated TonB-dependent outer membrane receptor [Aquisalimonas sp. APHAB1-3]|uniref:zinc-regulated TonB-dependent outer membrane receptor n=1 Tax=Aquisalimonas sp. APHAB1-3 TaxID=3402080 RepID=UPI003AAA535B